MAASPRSEDSERLVQCEAKGVPLQRMDVEIGVIVQRESGSSKVRGIDTKRENSLDSLEIGTVFPRDFYDDDL